jgi:hypothetical protein
MHSDSACVCEHPVQYTFEHELWYSQSGQNVGE